MRVKRILGIVLIALFCVSAVSVPVSAAPAVKTVKLSAAKATLGVKETLTLKATVSPSGASKKVTWKSGSAAVAKVDANGKVTAVKAGSATITATAAGGKKTSCKITVKAAPTKLTPSVTSKTLGVKEACTLKITYAPSGAAGAKTFSSSSKAVATVDKNGKITAVKAGTATITAKAYNGKTTKCTVNVKAAPTKVAASPASQTLGAGETLTLKTTYTPTAAAGAKTFSSSNNAVATVSSAGKITAVKAGTATITVKTYNGKTASCKVTVKASPTKVTASPASKTLGVGETLTLKTALTPTAAAGAITYSSSAASVAAVDAQGKVTAKKVGSATITVKTFNGKTASCKVTVKPAPTAITFPSAAPLPYSGVGVVMGIGAAYTLQTAYAPSNAAGAISFSSSDTTVAAVDAVGKVTTKKAGTAIITARAFNSETAKCTVIVLSLEEVLNAYNKTANDTKAQKDFSVTRVEDTKVEVTKLDAGFIYTPILRGILPSLLADVNKKVTTAETFKDGVGTINTGKTPQNFLPVQNQPYMSALKPESVQSASMVPYDGGLLFKITLKPEKIGIMDDAPMHHSGMDVLQFGIEDIAQYGTIDTSVSSMTYNGAVITAASNADGLLKTVDYDITATADGRITKLTYESININQNITVSLAGGMKQTYTFVW